VNKKNMKDLAKCMVFEEIKDQGLFCETHGKDFVHCERGRLSTRACRVMPKKRKKK